MVHEAVEDDDGEVVLHALRRPAVLVVQIVPSVVDVCDRHKGRYLL